MACGLPAAEGDRRLFAKSEGVFAIWKSTLVSEFNIDESTVQHTIETYKFMCIKCHNSYERFISHYDQIKSSLKFVICRVFESQSTEDDSCSDTRAHTDIDASAVIGQKRQYSDSVELISKRFKSPIVVHDPSDSGKNAATTTVIHVHIHHVGIYWLCIILS